MASGLWKHQQPLELESESETDTEADSPPQSFSIFGIPQKQPQPKPRRPKSNDEKQRAAERRAVREREREASRPDHQFVYQIWKERNESKTNPPMGKALTLPTSTRGHMRMSRTPGQSDGFGKEDGVYYLGCHGSMKSLLKRKPPTILRLFQRIRS